MSKFWRTAAISAAACAMVAVGVSPAFARPTTAPTLTIATNASSVYGYTLVGFKDGKYSKVAVTGNVSGATSGMVAQLFAQPFPYKKAAAPVVGQQQVLTGTSPEPYSFSSTPGIATRYSVEVLPSSTVSTPVQATSARQTVYVVTIPAETGVKTCNRAHNRPICHQTIRIYTLVPSSAYRAQSRLRLYFYFGIKLARIGVPKAPTWMSLDTAAKISKAKRISAVEFEQTVTFSFRVNNDGYNFNFNYCSKSAESSDGVNLPGHHHCGDKKVRPNWFLG